MTKRLHIALLALLGLSVLAACRQTDPEDLSGEMKQVTEGPVNVSMDLSFKGFGQDNTLTKGDFYEEGNDFVVVNDSLFYDHEKMVRDALVFVFDAKGVSDPKDAKFEKAVNLEHADVLPNNVGRVQFKLDKPYETIAVLILANYGLKPGDVSVAAGTTLENVVKYLSDPTNEAGSVHVIKSGQSKYITEGVPMYGWKVFGSTGKLRFYSGMTTPLTVCGFTSVSELENYAKTDTGIGTVRDTDVVPMEFALARLQLRYNYKARGTGKESIAADSVTIKSVKLNVYKDKFYRLPSNLLTLTLPRTRETLPNPYDNITTDYRKNNNNSDFNTGYVTFEEIPSKTGKSKAFVAYVPEISIKSVEDAIASAASFEEPSLVVEVDVIVREKTDGSVVTYTYDRNKIIVDDGINDPKPYENYGDQGWVSWLSFKTNQERKDKDNNVKAIGTRYSLVRHYSYEWLAVGVNE